MFKRAFFGISTLLLPLVSGQDVPKPPTVLAADVHVTPPDSRETIPGLVRNDQFEMRGMTALTMILRAYAGMDVDRILGGPRRLDFDKYDVIAKLAPGTKADAMPAILKEILLDRFKLVVKEETRPMQSYSLVLGKGKHKLKPAEGSEQRCNLQPGQGPAPTPIRVICKGYTTTMLANSILRSLGGLPTPVADQTGIQGSWDFELEFRPAALTGAGGSVASMVEAVEDQLGLKLEQKRTDVPVIVIESINTAPTPNEPGVAKLMAPPPGPMELEVATIRPSAPGGTQGGFSFRTDPQGGMQFETRGMRLSALINLAFGLSADRVSGLPPGADDQPYDIVAKMSGQAGSSLNNTLGPALKGLLEERFKLKAHLEDRPADAYKLVAVKPKMAKADPENRATCRSGVAPGAKDPREVTPGRTAVYYCRNVTMDEFAERLQGISVGFLRMPAVNATNLEGMFDFTLNYTPQLQTTILSTGTGAVMTNAAPAAAPVGGTFSTGPAPLAAADPSDNITFQEALNSQLGLKLELEKRPMPFLVIEHLEKSPTEN